MNLSASILLYLNLLIGVTYGRLNSPFSNADNVFLHEILATRNPDENQEPLIGILSQPLYHSLPNVSFIAASYVQFVEAAGARAVPIVYSDSIGEIKRRFKEVSGIILPGGTVGLDASSAEQYEGVAKMLFKMAMDEYEKGDVVAMHGFCMGFQMMMRYSASAGNRILSMGFDSSEHPNELMWTINADKSRLVGSMPVDGSENHIFNSDYIRTRMSQVPPIVLENHHEGIDIEDFLADSNLINMWDLLSISRDRVGRQYVSTVEARNYLFSGTQWHPEKNAYEWKSGQVPHQLDAIAATQFIASRFVNQAKFSGHRPASIDRLNELVIWNTAPVYHSHLVRDFELIFVYGPHEQTLMNELTKNPPPEIKAYVDKLYDRRLEL